MIASRRAIQRRNKRDCKHEYTVGEDRCNKCAKPMPVELKARMDAAFRNLSART